MTSCGKIKKYKGGLFFLQYVRGGGGVFSPRTCGSGWRRRETFGLQASSENTDTHVVNKQINIIIIY